jgi:hypothetical protein
VELRFIDVNTKLTILEYASNEEIIRTYTGRFRDIERGLTFLAESDELNTDKIGAETRLRVEFLRGTHLFAFDAKLHGKLIKDGKQLIMLDQTSEIKESTHRAAPRIELTASVTVFESMDYMQSGYVISQGVSLDISADGLCLLTNQQIAEEEKTKRYILDFSFGKYRFILPARLIRMSDSAQFIQFKFEYGFIFEYSENSDEKSRLITSMLQYRLQNNY